MTPHPTHDLDTPEKAIEAAIALVTDMRKENEGWTHWFVADDIRTALCGLRSRIPTPDPQHEGLRERLREDVRIFKGTPIGGVLCEALAALSTPAPPWRPAPEEDLAFAELGMQALADPPPDPQGLVRSQPSAALASVSVCNCGADTFNRIRTDGGVVPHAPKCAALASHPPERAGEPTDTERLEWWLLESGCTREYIDQKLAARKAAGEGKS